MNSVLDELYHGNLCPEEQYVPQMEEYKAKQAANFRHYEDFLAQLDDPLRKRFVEILDEQYECIPYDTSQMFINGFRLGARLMLEVLAPQR